jgi:hypothetical protein
MSRLPETAWNVAKGEARNMMIDRAKLRGMITYSELAASITSVRLRVMIYSQSIGWGFDNKSTNGLIISQTAMLTRGAAWTGHRRIAGDAARRQRSGCRRQCADALRLALARALAARLARVFAEVPGATPAKSAAIRSASVIQPSGSDRSTS